MLTRDEKLQSIRNQADVTVLIVGGGINGAGLFRDLTLQGVDVLMVDKSDFCSGASAASSHMAHGGLRYLENGEFRLVREALVERNLLLRNAPHYVQPMPTTIPIFHWTAGMFNAAKKFFRLGDKPGNRGALIIKVGLTLYDIFARRYRVMPTHRFTSRAKALALRPQIDPRIVCTVTYYDAWIACPERLCLEVILDAEETAIERRAIALNYVRLEAASGGTATLRDEVTGATFEVRPKIVINATGAWIDFTNRAMKKPSKLIGGTKGSHLMIDHKELFEATHGHEFFFETADGRICIFYPFFDKVMIGSTDIRVDDPETARTDENEVDYILASVRHVFPSIKLDRSHIVFWFCGVRPLPSSEDAHTGTISRDHSYPLTPPGNGIDFPIYSLVGGKWTTFRAFAEQVTDRVLSDLGKERRKSTESLPIGGGKDYPTNVQVWLSTLQAKTQISQERLKVLLERYGTRAEAVAAFIAAESDEALRTLRKYSRREIAFMALNEQLVHLDDLVLRRTLMGFLGQSNTAVIEELAGVVGATLNWSQEQIQQEIERTRSILEKNHGVKFEPMRVPQ
jgi:glycerol-3-phosphate dehydrogenase